MDDTNHLDGLAEDLTPVRPLRPGALMIAVGLLTLAGAAIVIAVLGFRDQHGATSADPEFLGRTALLIALGTASLHSAAAMARPQVGASQPAWRWILAVAMLVPAGAGVAALVSRSPLADRMHMNNGVECLAYSIGMGLVIGGVLTWWLRRGAPTSPERAGTVVGLAAGSLGALAYSMHCPHNDILYIGSWYTLAIGATTLAGRLCVPGLIRW